MAITDNFNRANGPIGSNWTVGLFDSSALAISSNVLVWTTNGGTIGSIQYTGVSWNNDQSSQALNANVSSGLNYWAVAVRLTTTTSTNFSGYCFFSHGQVQIVTSGTNGGLFGTSGGIDFTQTAKLDATGTTLTASVNGSVLGSGTDSTYSAGSPGLAVYNNGVNLGWDDWVGTGEISGAAATFIPHRMLTGIG